MPPTPATPAAGPAPALKSIPLQAVHEALGAKMAPFAGYLMPVRYSSDQAEHHAVRQRAGLFDVSHMGEFLVEGPEALGLVQHVTTNDASKLSPGQAQYSVLCHESGGAVDDLLVYCISADRYLLVVNASNIEKDLAHIRAHNPMGAQIRDISADWCLFALQGPLASEILTPLVGGGVSPADLAYYTFAVGQVGGVEGVMISATGYTGAGGFELYVPAAKGQQVWEALMTAGTPMGMVPVGLGARDTLRLEMGYCLYGHELDDETTPLEAGLGWVTKLAKGDFVGRQALEAQKAAGLERRLIGFAVEGRGGIPRAGYTLANAHGNPVGTVTSGTVSPTAGIGIGMGFVATGHHAPGTSLQVIIRDRAYLATVVKLPVEAVAATRA